MREILKRAAYLFWQYPILWLPVLLADFLKYWVLAAGHRIALVASFALVKPSANLVGVALYCYALGVLTRAVSGFTPEPGFSTSKVLTTESAADVNESSEVAK